MSFAQARDRVKAQVRLAAPAEPQQVSQPDEL